jgi:hypothetical protein
LSKLNFTCPIAFFLKKQSSPSHEEIKRQAKFWCHSPRILQERESQSRFP